LPHPRAHERAFVLAPLAEVRPGWRHPGLGEPVEALLARLGEWPGLVRMCGPEEDQGEAGVGSAPNR
jgi:2-amino-4-hydroxy-6-hydroxymethyldihydropteridine diphosphokinase